MVSVWEWRVIMFGPIRLFLLFSGILYFFESAEAVKQQKNMFREEKVGKPTKVEGCSDGMDFIMPTLERVITCIEGVNSERVIKNIDLKDGTHSAESDLRVDCAVYGCNVDPKGAECMKNLSERILLHAPFFKSTLAKAQRVDVAGCYVDSDKVVALHREIIAKQKSGGGLTIPVAADQAAASEKYLSCYWIESHVVEGNFCKSGKKVCTGSIICQENNTAKISAVACPASDLGKCPDDRKIKECAEDTSITISSEHVGEEVQKVIQGNSQAGQI